MRNIRLDIDSKELKKKLDIKDGKTPSKQELEALIKPLIPKPIAQEQINTSDIALEASKLAQAGLESKIPTSTQIAEQIPVVGEKVRDSLELLNGSERLARTAIDGLDDYEEISKLARTKPQIIKGGGGGGTQNLQQVTDAGSSTTNVITNKAEPTFSYSLGNLTEIFYSDGTTKTLTYNVDNTLATLTISKAGNPDIVKSFSWSSGILQSISIV